MMDQLKPRRTDPPPSDATSGRGPWAWPAPPGRPRYGAIVPVLVSAAFLLILPALSAAQGLETILHEAFDLGLGTKGGLPVDLAMAGQFTDAAGTAQPIKILIKGRNMRYDTGGETNKQTTIFRDGEVWSVTAAGARKLGAETMVRRPSVIPILDLVREVRTAGVEISAAQSMKLGEMLVQRVEITQPGTGPADHEKLSVYVETTTKLIVRTERFRRAVDNPQLRMPSVLDFSDYRASGGLMIPFKIVNTMGTERTGYSQSVLTLSGVTIDEGIADAMFDPE